MFWKKSETEKPSGNTTNTIARQDGRTTVRVTSAQTATTNTSVQNATIINSNTNTVTYQTTTQTVTHRQQATVLETFTRRTPTQQELAEVMATLSLSNTASLASKFESSNGKTARQNTPLYYKTEESAEQRSGQKVTSKVEERSVKLNKTAATTSNRSGLTQIKSDSALGTTSYTSPYTQRTVSQFSTDARPFAISNNTYRSAPLLSSSRTIVPQPNTRTYSPSVSGASLGRSSISSAPNLSGASTSSAARSSLSSTPIISKAKSKLKPGCVYIFNNVKFDDPKQEERSGSKADVKSLRETFTKFNAKIEVFQNPTRKDILNTVRTIQVKNFDNRSYIAVVILSHGTRFEKVLAKDTDYSIDDNVLFPMLENRTLIDKPKLFFIQACKGDLEVGQFRKDARQPIGTPSEILKCYSTFEGYVAYRDPNDGSFFIQTLCKKLNDFGDINNIEDIMKTVIDAVKQRTDGKQVPSVTSTLTKPFIFGEHA